MRSRVTDCQQRVLLSQQIAGAILRKHKAREDARAVEGEQDGTLLLQALAEARTAERVLVSKLAQHRLEHGC